MEPNKWCHKDFTIEWEKQKILSFIWGLILISKAKMATKSLKVLSVYKHTHVVYNILGWYLYSVYQACYLGLGRNWIQQNLPNLFIADLHKSKWGHNNSNVIFRHSIGYYRHIDKHPPPIALNCADITSGYTCKHPHAVFSPGILKH
jgi:hypothetical protein